MLSRKDLNSAELETVRVSKSPTTVVAASGQVRTNDEATVYVKKLFIRDSNASRRYTDSSLTFYTLCEDHGHSREWTSGQKPYLIRDGRRIQCSTENYVPIVVPLFIDRFLLSFTQRNKSITIHNFGFG